MYPIWYLRQGMIIIWHMIVTNIVSVQKMWPSITATYMYIYIYVMQMLAAHHLPIPRDWLCSESLVSLSCVCVCQRISALQELESLSLENSSLGEWILYSAIVALGIFTPCNWFSMTMWSLGTIRTKKRYTSVTWMLMLGRLLPS